MIFSVFKALSDVFSPSFRAVLLKSVGLAVLLFVLLLAAVEALFWFLTFVPWPWLDTLLAIGAGLGLFAAFFFLMAPVTALFAGLFLDDIAAQVEARHYGADKPGQALSGARAFAVGLQFGLVVLMVNLLALPLVFTGFGAVVLLVINAYLLSREYFEMAAMRHLPVDEAKALRKENGAMIFLAGFIPALGALVPVVNLVVPLFATAYFVHLFKRVVRTSA